MFLQYQKSNDGSLSTKELLILLRSETLSFRLNFLLDVRVPPSFFFLCYFCTRVLLLNTPSPLSARGFQNVEVTATFMHNFFLNK